MTLAHHWAQGERRRAAPPPRRATTVESLRELSPSRRAIISVFVMTATIMQVLDTTVANVSLPYMQGTLSTTQDQINWVLTSYIIASAIMTSPVGWMSARFGRKRLYIVCTVGFTVASMLCGISQNIEQMVLFRLTQGAFGAALVPLAQAVMLDAYPTAQRAAAMAIWGMGIMIGPIMGPVLGGYLTENYSWRWVFYVNVPFGVLTALGLSVFMPESRVRRDAAVRLVRLPVAVARRRRAANDARSRPGHRLVRLRARSGPRRSCRSPASISSSPTASPASGRSSKRASSATATSRSRWC